MISLLGVLEFWSLGLNLKSLQISKTPKLQVTKVTLLSRTESSKLLSCGPSLLLQPRFALLVRFLSTFVERVKTVGTVPTFIINHEIREIHEKSGLLRGLSPPFLNPQIESLIYSLYSSAPGLYHQIRSFTEILEVRHHGPAKESLCRKFSLAELVEV